jgi:hypothetical protein
MVRHASSPQQRRLAQPALEPPAMIERLLGSELSCAGTPMQLLSRGAGLARRDHFVGINLHHHWGHRLDEAAPTPWSAAHGVLKPGVGAEKIIERFALESDVLKRSADPSLCIGRNFRHLEEHNPVIGLIIAQRRHRGKRRPGVCGTSRTMMHLHSQHFAVPIDHWVQLSGEQPALDER